MYQHKLLWANLLSGAKTTWPRGPCCIQHWEVARWRYPWVSGYLSPYLVKPKPAQWSYSNLCLPNGQSKTKMTHVSSTQEGERIWHVPALLITLPAGLNLTFSSPFPILFCTISLPPTIPHPVHRPTGNYLLCWVLFMHLVLAGWCISYYRWHSQTGGKCLQAF